MVCWKTRHQLGIFYKKDVFGDHGGVPFVRMRMNWSDMFLSIALISKKFGRSVKGLSVWTASGLVIRFYRHGNNGEDLNLGKS